MKAITALILFFGIVQPAFCQVNLKGKVTDAKTGLSIPYVTIRVKGTTVTTLSREDGSFAITIHEDYMKDTLAFSSIGYEEFKMLTRDIDHHKEFNIRLNQGSGVLDEVLIRVRSHKLDSLRNRREFSSAFNYKAPGIKDIFITKDPVFTNEPVPYFKAQNSTSSIASINLLKVADLLSKNKAPVSKLQKTLLKEEEDNYVNAVFSKEKIASITGLKEDSLQTFINRYKPSASILKQMNAYEQVSYIKKSYSEFLKPSAPANTIEISR